MTEWKDVLQLVGSTLGNEAGDSVLEFLKVLPEEVTEGRKINLTVRAAGTLLNSGRSRKTRAYERTSLLIL